MKKKSDRQLATAKQVAKLGLAEKRRLAAKGRKAIAMVLAMKRQVETAFYAMGKALVTLADKGVIRALGHPSFEALCEVELKMSDAQAMRLIHIVESFPQRDVAHLTSTKATAIIDLAGALGHETTPRGLVKRGTIHLPNGQTIDVRGASAARIAGAARTVRARHSSARAPGIHVSAEDGRLVASIVRELRRAKVTARVDAIAAGTKTGAKMRLTVNVRDAKKVGRALLHAG